MQGSQMVRNKRGQLRKRRPRRYTAEFKEKAVKLARRGDRSMAMVAKELGVPAKTLYGWVADYEHIHGSVAPENETPEQKVKRLEKEVELLREEREILKKAATFFAKESE